MKGLKWARIDDTMELAIGKTITYLVRKAQCLTDCATDLRQMMTLLLSDQ